MPIPIVAAAVAVIAGAFASACSNEEGKKEEFVTNKKGEKCVPNQTVHGEPLCYGQDEYKKLTTLKNCIASAKNKEESKGILEGIFSWFSADEDVCPKYYDEVKNKDQRYDILYNLKGDERAQRFPGLQGALMTIVKDKDEFINLRSYAAHALWPMPLPSTTSDPDVIRAMSYGIRFDL